MALPPLKHGAPAGPINRLNNTQFGSMVQGAVTKPIVLGAKTNQAIGNFGARRNLGGPTGRLRAMEAGYHRTLAYQQPGARGLINALQGSFGQSEDVLDPFTRENLAFNTGNK